MRVHVHVHDIWGVCMCVNVCGASDRVRDAFALGSESYCMYSQVMQMGHVHAHTQEKHQAAQFLLENRKCTFAEVSVRCTAYSTAVSAVRAAERERNFSG